MLLRPHYPQTARTLTSHYAIYNDCLNRAQQLSQQGRVLILAPDSLNGLSTLTRDIPKLEAFYQKGYEAAKAVKAFLQA
jgi:predicted patatin/cPLA2 family phospholipase